MKFLAAILLIMATQQITATAAEPLRVIGSDTMVKLMQAMADAYMKKNPDKQVAVTGGGTGVGIEGLIEHRCDLANASRLMKPEEIQDARDAGLTPRRFVIAVDGLSIVVNSANPVEKLTLEQVGSIYRGDITNWKQVGGKDADIVIFGRKPSSGTFDYFRNHVIRSDYSTRMKRMIGNPQIIEAVVNEENGIGYVGVGYARQAKGISILSLARDTDGDFLSPLDEDAVLSGRYPISRPLHQYLSGWPNERIRDFLQFEVSGEGQRVIKESGFFRIPDEYREYNAESAGIR